jgi:hypothetical protein
MRPRLALELAAAACVAAPLLVLVGAPPWARFPAVLLMLSLAPGTALLHLLQPPGRRIEAGLAVGISLAVTVVIAQCMLWAGAWHPELLVHLLAGSCLACMAGPWLGVRALRRIRPAVEAGDDPPPFRHCGWILVRRYGRPVGLVALPFSEPLGSELTVSSRDRDALGTSILLRPRGDLAAPRRRVGDLAVREDFPWLEMP